jgi:hypothetical protein
MRRMSGLPPGLPPARRASDAGWQDGGPNAPQADRPQRQVAELRPIAPTRLDGARHIQATAEQLARLEAFDYERRQTVTGTMRIVEEAKLEEQQRDQLRGTRNASTGTITRPRRVRTSAADIRLHPPVIQTSTTSTARSSAACPSPARTPIEWCSIGEQEAILAHLRRMTISSTVV